MVTASAAAALVATLLGGCTLITDSFLSNDFSGDAFPVNVDTTSGAVMVGLQPAGSGETDAVFDLLSPLTVTDSGAGAIPEVSYLDLTLLGFARPDLTDPTNTRVPRARFVGAQLLAVHPCDANDANADGVCHVGDAGQASYQSLIGADALAGDAVRLRLGDNQLFVLPDIGGDDRHRTLDCDAVFDSPYRGGGTLVIDGTELPFGNRRIALQACLGPNPGATPQSQRGTDVLFVVSTGIGISILGQSAYLRYQLLHPAAAAIDDLPDGSVYLPSGIVHGKRAAIDSLSLVASSSSNALAPCRQIYAHRVLALRSVGDNCQDAGGDCPCENGTGFCAVPAILELTPPAGIAILVVSDADPTLQALRTELRPDQPEVDGILGVDALRTAEIDVDYPHDRLLARCPGGNCCIRPELAQESDRAQINRCIASQNTLHPQAPLATCPTDSVIPVAAAGAPASPRD